MSTQSTPVIAELVEALLGAGRVVAVGHEKPDGDAFGSVIALVECLREAARPAVAVGLEPVGDSYGFMLGLRDAVAAADYSPREGDLVAICDCGAPDRVPGSLRDKIAGLPTVCIDHHKTSGGFDGVCYVDPDASSTSELVWRVARAAGWRVNEVAAEALWVGLVTDTGRFAYDCTSPETLECAADVLRAGRLNTAEINERLFGDISLERLRLQRRAIGSLAMGAGGGVALVSLSTADYAECGADTGDSENFVDIPRSIRGVEIAAFLYPGEDGKVTRISLRTRPPYDAAEFCRDLGGGGHARAAGATLPWPLPEAAEKALRMLVGWKAGHSAESYHLAGVAGVGMSALAELLLDTGAAVSGSDRRIDSGDSGPVLERLEARGAILAPQDGSAVKSSLTALVVSSAIEEDNPEVVAAKRAGLPVRLRAEVLSEVLRRVGRPLIAVAGTSGKSTTTAILGALLAGTGHDPLVVNGAAVLDWRTETRNGSVRFGKGDYCVAELDESDRSLLDFRPEHAIITNASADHFPIGETLRLFERFRERVGGVLIDGIADGMTAPDFVPLAWGSSFEWEGRVYEVPLPGFHNAMNAWQALRMALALGIEPGALARALAAFRGVERRLERVGVRSDGVSVVDDYAHNTEKLRAAWNTLARGHERVIGLWRPHGYGPLRAMLEELAAMFAETCRPRDTLFLLPVYDAGGTANRSVNSDALAAALLERGAPARLVGSHAEAIDAIRSSISPGCVVATLGARDPELPRTARLLLA